MNGNRLVEMALDLGFRESSPKTSLVRDAFARRRTSAAAFDQTQSFPIRGNNVCFRRKPPLGFRHRALTPLMTAIGWVAALSETIAECAFNPLRERVVNDVHDRAASIHQYRQISPVSKPNTLAP